MQLKTLVVTLGHLRRCGIKNESHTYRGEFILNVSLNPEISDV
jgi:hypothetical protein